MLYCFYNLNKNLQVEISFKIVVSEHEKYTEKETQLTYGTKIKRSKSRY